MWKGIGSAGGRVLVVLATCMPTGLAWAAPAGAAWFAAEPVDAGVAAVGGMDLARDGTGAFAYVKPVAGVPHVFLSRMRDGAEQPPERVDADVAEAGSDPVVAAASGGRLVVAWRSGGTILGAFSDGGALSAPSVLASGSAVGPPDADMAIQGTAYVVFAVDGDVRAVRLRADAWSPVPDPLDVDASQGAGAGPGRPRVAVAADGNAVVTWAENHPDGRRRVYGRRVTELRVSAVPQEVSLPALEGRPGGDADSPDIAIEEDGSFAWVVWRQDFAGVSRSVARRLVGSLFEAPARLDGWPGATGSRAPRVSMNGDGAGLAVAQGDRGEVGLSLLADDAFRTAAALAPGTAPLAAEAESRDAAVVWESGAGLVGRRADRDKPLGIPTPLGAGSGATELASDQYGDFAVAFQQADRPVVAVWDEPPGVAALRTTRKFTNLRRSPLRWTAGRELWGAQTFRVLVDRKVIGTTTNDTFIPARAPSDGRHVWAVESVDRRGQVARTAPRRLRVDTRRPHLRVRVSGSRRAGASVIVQIAASDAHAGLARIRSDPGDGGARIGATRFAHRYRRGTFVLTVRAFDRAGNVAVRHVTLRIR